MNKKQELPNLMLLNVEHIQLDESWNWCDVSSPFARVFFVTDGLAELIIGNNSYPLRPGHAYVIPPHTRHSYRCPHSVTIYYLHVYEKYGHDTGIFDRYEFPVEMTVNADEFNLILGTLCDGYSEFRLPTSNPATYDNHNVFLSYVNRYDSLPQVDKMLISGLLLVLFSRLLAQVTPREWTHDHRMVSAVNYIHNNIDREIEIGALADIACMSDSYFSRYFKKIFGMPPLRYVLEKKIEHSQILLITEDAPVKEIAYRVGFSDSSYFIRTFRQLTGRTPRAYRAESH
jgi:AraC-like DNA-binding protein